MSDSAFAHAREAASQRALASALGGDANAGGEDAEGIDAGGGAVASGSGGGGESLLARLRGGEGGPGRGPQSAQSDPYWQRGQPYRSLKFVSSPGPPSSHTPLPLLPSKAFSVGPVLALGWRPPKGEKAPFVFL